MRIVFLGKNPTIGNCKGINALQYLLDNNIDVVRVVASQNNIREYSLSKNLIVKDEKEVYNEIIKGKLNNYRIVARYPSRMT